MHRAEITQKLSQLIQPYIADQRALPGLEERSELVSHLNINSLHLIDIALDVEEAFDIEINDRELEALVRVESVLDLIEEKLAAKQAPPAS